MDTEMAGTEVAKRPAPLKRNQVYLYTWNPWKVPTTNIRTRFLPQQVRVSYIFKGNWVFEYTDKTRNAFKDPFAPKRQSINLKWNAIRNYSDGMKTAPFAIEAVPGIKGVDFLDRLLGAVLKHQPPVLKWVTECRLLINKFKTTESANLGAHMLIFQELLEKMTSVPREAVNSPSALFTTYFDGLYVGASSEDQKSLLEGFNSFFMGASITAAFHYNSHPWTLRAQDPINVVIECPHVTWIGLLKYVTPTLKVAGLHPDITRVIEDWQSFIACMAFFETNQGNGIVVVPEYKMPVSDEPAFVDNESNFYCQSPPEM